MGDNEQENNSSDHDELPDLGDNSSDESDDSIPDLIDFSISGQQGTSGRQKSASGQQKTSGHKASSGKKPTSGSKKTVGTGNESRKSDYVDSDDLPDLE